MVRPYRRWLLLIFLAMLLETVMSLAAPWPLKIIIDNVIGGHHLPAWLGWVERMRTMSGNLSMAAFAAGAMVLFAVIGAIAAYVNSYFTESIAQSVANDLRMRIYHHLQRLSLAYYDTHQTGKIISTITTDVSTIQDFAASSLLKILIDTLTITGMLALMVYLNWDFALIVVGIAPFILLFVARFKKKVKKATREVRKDQSTMVAILQQGLESMRAVNAFGRQELEEEKLRNISLITVNDAMRARRLKAMLVPVVSVIISICVALVLWRGAALVLAGVMTIGALTVFLSYLTRFFSPVQDLAKLTSSFAQATVALERIQVILEADNIIPEHPQAVDPGTLKGNIHFDKVCFAYGSDHPVLQDFSLNIRSGQRIGICGPTGSGKSTVACLIPRFYDPVSGTIIIDGKDAKEYTVEGLRSQIGFVLQDTVLFYGSIKDNIAYGRPGATGEEIMEAARQANAHEFIMRMPEGYDSMVGERGLTLSGGQRQCIGIARALVRNAPILILDEPTASLDTESELLVMEALERLMEGRTVIIIAHRLSTILDADNIVVIRDGVVVQQGCHAALMEEGGLYSELFGIQASFAG
jgi:ABC-type multidrug transport system fused ATPase/permease subunit